MITETYRNIILIVNKYTNIDHSIYNDSTSKKYVADLYNNPKEEVII